MSRPTDAMPGTPTRPDIEAYAFFAAACAITWLLATPLALAWSRHEIPPSYAVACAGLSAFGPTLAALALARGSGARAEAFGRWRANPVWVGVALLAPLVIHLVATTIYVGLGGHPDSWLHPPDTAESLAALVVFPLGEEFGWRGFAHPRMVERHGLVKGPLLLGLVWGVWHLVYSVTPQAGAFDLGQFAIGVAELPLYSLVIAWVFERENRSMAVAIAFHAGAHLDHIERARGGIGLQAVHIAVVAVLAVMAARSLARRASRPLTAAGGHLAH
jgi:membrane protease YdiL (CAAX protease family)